MGNIISDCRCRENENGCYIEILNSNIDKQNYTLKKESNMTCETTNIEHKKTTDLNKSFNSDLILENFEEKIDYYQLARNIFYIINEIRLSKEDYYNKLASFNFTSDLQNLMKNDKNIYNKIKDFLYKNIDIQSDIILWNEKLYLAITKQFLENKNNIDEYICQRLNGQYYIYDFLTESLSHNLDIIIWKLLTDNFNNIAKIINKNYIMGTVFVVPSVGGLKIMLYLLNKK